jgi:CRP-like cAMP-binding protein
MPWRKLAHRRERARVYKLMLEMARVMQESAFDGLSFGSTIDAVFVGCCVGLGHAEDRPMTATKISHYLNMPRTTVLRKLDELIAVNAVKRVGNFYLVADERHSRVQWLARCNVAIVSYAKEIAQDEALRGSP